MQFRKLIFMLSVCALLACGSAAQAGFIDNHDGTVTDTGTGLMWQQATAPSTSTWEEALGYCESLDFAGHTDWRLPTAKELASIVDTTRYNKSINPVYFPDTVAFSYWSSTTDVYVLGSGSVWSVYFDSGQVLSSLKSLSLYVRAVRGGQSGSFDNVTLWPVPDTGQNQSYTNTFGEDHDYTINQPAYTKLANGCTALPDNATAWETVRDDVTGLVWEVKHDSDSIDNYTKPNDADNVYTWYDSNPATNGGIAGTPGNGADTEDFIRDLNTASYGGFSDWRMPTDKELQSIADYGLYNPTINTMYFSNTVASGYWSSITDAFNAVNAWYVSFYYGYMDDNNKSKGNYARAVRGGQSGTLGELVILKSGTGAGAVTSADGKIDCGSDCRATYISCAEVTLATMPENGSTFTGWSGGGCSGTGSCVVAMNTNLTVTANFDLVPTTTTTSVGPTTTISPCIDKDGDGYGDNCTAGADCNDNDSFYNETCPDCTVKVIPGVLGWFLGEKEKTRRLIVIGKNGAEFDENTPVRWETDAIAVVSKRVLFKRFMFMKVRIDGEAFGTGDYRALIGDCSGKLTLVK